MRDPLLLQLEIRLEGWLKETKPYENPLVPNAKLKQIYTTMVEARALDEISVRLTARARTGRLNSVRGQEAVRVSTAIELTSGDLISDSQNGLVMQRIAGVGAASLFRQMDAIRAGEKDKLAKQPRRGGAARVLPWVEDAEDRLQMALGAALSLKVLGNTKIVIAYAYSRGLSDHAWRRILKRASQLDLPIIFVLLPTTVSNRGERSMSARAVACGVPGFPVDASDAVALYRVAQESIARSRGDGGPILIECLSHRSPSELRSGPDDPIRQMRGFLLGRKVASKAWLDRAGGVFLAQAVRASARSRTNAKRAR